MCEHEHIPVVSASTRQGATSSQITLLSCHIERQREGHHILVSGTALSFPCFYIRLYLYASFTSWLR